MNARRFSTGVRAAVALILALPAGASVAHNSPPPTEAAPRIVLTDGHRAVARTAKELGLVPQVDSAALIAALKRIAPAFHQDAINAAAYLHAGKVYINPGRYARAMNIAATADRIGGAWKAGKHPTEFTVALDKKPPVLTADRLKGIDTVLSRVETKAWNHPGRNHNIALAASLIDGTLLSPGEQFSLNKIVGPRDKSRGFRESIIFVNSQEVKGVGGGVSQITGTTFNAAAKAGLQIDEAHFHSRPVPYLPYGFDATVAYGQKDMKFTNDTGGPVYIGMDWKFPYLTATIFGHRQPGRQVRLKASVAKLAPGKVNAELYRTIKVDGKVVKKEKLVTHAYRWDPHDNKVHDD